jgi:hypothetical protein
MRLAPARALRGAAGETRNAVAADLAGRRAGCAVLA